MRLFLAVVLSAAPAAAQVRTAPTPLPALPRVPPVFSPAPPSGPAFAAPALPSALPRAPGVPVLPAAPVLPAGGAARAAALPAVPVIAESFSPFGAALADFASGFADKAKGPSAVAAGAEASALFDGLKASGDSGARAAVLPAGFARRELSGADGARLSYAVRRPREETAAARVFVGGMTLPDSFLTYLDAGPAAHADYVLSLRGLPPSGWTPTREVFDADARDLARMVLKAAGTAPGGRVELVLHSYGTLAFQRMLQLRSDPEVSRALSALRGGRVVMFAATTHYGDSETVAGPEYAEMARQVRMFISWLDAGDSYLEQWRAAARLNPLLIPQVEALAAAWSAQRSAALAMAAQGASSLLFRHLSEPWAPELEATRRRLIEETRRASADAGWQEAAMRRANDTSKLDFDAADAAALRAAGVRLDIVVSRQDQLIPWKSSRLLPALFGITLPEAVPAAGSSFRDESGLVRVLFADGDHYLPLKDPATVRTILDR